MKINKDDEKAFEQIASRLTAAEKAVSEVREQLFVLYSHAEMVEAPAKPERVEIPVPKPAPTPPPSPPVAAMAATPPPIQPPMQTPPMGVEKRVPWWEDERRIIKYVAIGGVLITLAGVSLLIALAVQSGWLGPLARVVGAWVLAVALMLGAYIVRERGLSREGRYALSTASLLTAILTVMATVSMLNWWSPLVGALVLLALLAVYSAIARAWDDQWMLIITIVSSFALFYLYLVFGDFFAFPLIAPALFVATCSMQRRWVPSRNIAAFIAPLAIPAGLIDDSFPIAFTVIIGVATFTAISLLDEWNDPSDRNLGFYSPMVMFALGAIFTSSFVELTILVAAIVAFTILSALFHGKFAVAPLTALPIVYLLWWSHAPAMGSQMLLERPVLVALFFLAFSGFAFWLARNNRYGWYPWASTFAVGLILTSELGGAVLAKKPLWLTSHIAPVQALAILIFMVVIFLLRHSFKKFPTTAQVLIGLAGLHLSTLIIVTMCTYVFSFLGQGMMWLGYLIGHALVSILWMLLAAYILVVTNAFSQRTSLAVGLILAIAAVVKLVFFDLGTLEGLPRVLAFLISGLALLGIASLRAKKASDLARR
ncbi:DUF2339 domain-containing protein [Corynebacterium sp. H130]|uniref:DUF2339 domain-containing protein n=1 Tax=Corynebacterium sp. H130 TaxID=3133444 RepID=UPI00309C6038